MNKDTPAKVEKGSVLMDSILSTAAPDASPPRPSEPATPEPPTSAPRPTDFAAPEPSEPSVAQSSSSSSSSYAPSTPTAPLNPDRRPASPDRRVNWKLPLQTDRALPTRASRVFDDAAPAYRNRSHRAPTHSSDTGSLTYVTLGACSILTLISAALFF